MKTVTAFRSWLKQHPELWVGTVLFLASYFFCYSFGQVARWTEGIQQGRLAYFCNWDCGWYMSITRDGYDAYPHFAGGQHPRGDAANWAFFPLFPLSAIACKHLFRIDPTTSAVLASKIEYFTAILAFLLWMRPHLRNKNEYFLAGSLIALNPYLIYGHAGYSEPLYFTLACLGFWAVEKQKWILAGFLGAGLSANRLVGVLFALVYVIVALREIGWRSLLRNRHLDVLLGFLLCPLGLVLFTLYLYHRTGDALAFIHIQVAWGRRAMNPLLVLANSFEQHGWSRVRAVMAVSGLLVSVWFVRRRPEYGIFLALSIILPCVSGSLYGLPRYLWWQPPLLYAIFTWLRRSTLAWMVYLAFAGGMASFMVLQWFTGNSLVI